MPIVTDIYPSDHCGPTGKPAGHRSETAPRAYWRLGVLLPAMGLLGASLSAPRIARAHSGNSFLETMGISIAVGTVLGASTLPFYDQPGKNLMNVAYGASAGAAVGIGILVFSWITGPSRDAQEWTDGTARFEPELASVTQWQDTRAGARAGGPRLSAVRARGSSLAANSVPSQARYPAQFWTPLVSLTW